MKERKVFKMNKGFMKRLFSLVLAIALVLNMGQIMPGSTVEAAENYQVTFHYKNVKNYGNLNLYVWTGSSTNHAGGWPGTAMTKNEDNAQWFDLTLTVPATTVKYIVNNGSGAQTADLSINLSSKPSDVWVTGAFTSSKEKLSATTTAPSGWVVPTVEPEVTATFHFWNYFGGSQVSFYAFDNAKNEVMGGWPGVSATATTGKTGWYDAKLTDYEKDAVNVIFSGKNVYGETVQTADLAVDLTAGKEFWVYENLVLTEAPRLWSEVEGPESYEVTIYYDNNSSKWGTVGLWAWNPNGNVFTSNWPGASMNAEECNSGWTKYTFTQTSDLLGFIVNGNNGSNQTANMYAFLKEAKTELWVSGGNVSATAPEGWEVKEEEPTVVADATVHFWNPGWDKVGFYAWDSVKSNQGWPGVETVENSDHEGWYDGIVYGFEDDSIKVIFNNMLEGDDYKRQTADLAIDLTAGNEFWVYENLVLTEAPRLWTNAEGPDLYEVTIYYDNSSSKWNSVGIWAWNPNGNMFSGWPGEAMETVENHDNWTMYTLNQTSDLLGFLVNGNSGSNQTGNMFAHLTDAKTELWVSGETYSTVAPEGWDDIQEKPEEDEEEITTYNATIHFRNVLGGNQVAFYAWDSKENKIAGVWPGALVDETEGKTGWYTATVTNYPEEILNFIFNDNKAEGAVQTSDLTANLAQANEFWVLNGEVLTTVPELWNNPIEVPTSFDVVVHYKNSAWNNFCFYSWNGSGNLAGAWPGTPATANAKNAGWQDFFLTDIKDSTFNFIWNNGNGGDGNQTADLKHILTEGYTELWVENGNISTTAPSGWVKTYTVKLHYNNPNNWSNIHLYAWYGTNSVVAGAWPGTPATENECNPGWYDYTIQDAVDPNFKQIWNIGSNAAQTKDISLPKPLTKAYTELWVVGEKVTDVEPETWSNRLPVAERDVYVPGTLPGPSWDAASNKMEYLGNGIYKLELKNVPAANYEYKIAIGGTWDENYGANGAANGGNIKLVVPYAQDVTIYYSDVTHFAVDTINYIFADITLSGKNVPEGTKLADEGLTGIYSVSVNLPAGTYEDIKLTYDGKEYTFAKFVVSEEKKVTFCMDPLSGLFYHDSSATKVKASALYFDSKSLEYKSVFGAVATGQEVKFSLTTGDDVTSASLFFKGMENRAVAMSKDGDVVNGKQKWSVTTSLSAIGEYDYYFAVSNGADVCVYGDDDGYYGTGKTSGLTDVMPYDLVVYKAGFTTPDWMKNGVIYQIFPDRFFDGNPNNNQAQTSARGDVDYEFIEDWSVIPENPEQEDLLDEETYKSTGAYYGDRNWSNEIYGGDIKGITQRIDYLKALGVTVIYLNPVFHSISSHRYDACDYTKIDPILGTEGDFTELVTIAEANGMTVVLDGVFNHVSDDSIYFDRYYKFIDDGLDTIGAYPYWAYVYDYMAEKGVSQATAETAAKQYFSSTYGVSDYSYTEWFYVSSEYMKDDKGNAVKDKIGQRAGKPVYTYEGWWGYDSMPVIKSTNGSEYQTGNWAEDIIYNAEGTSVTQYWISRGMDGWRLDVANEVSDETWQAFRESVKALDSEAVIIGEIWDDATKYILGDMYDSVMNYQFRNAVTSFAMGSDAATVTKQMEKIRERYPQEAFYAMMNLVGSHDTSRILSYLDGIGDDRNDKSIAAAFPTYEKTSQLAKQRQYLVAFLQFTYAGAPTIYYGDEVGVVGCDDPDDRRTFPWGQGAEELVTYYATLAQIRSAYPALRTGSVETISTGNSKVMGYVRAEGEEVVVVLANNATSTQKVVVDVAKYGITASQLQDMLGGAVYAVADGKVTVNVPALKGVILVEEAKTISVDVDALAPAFDEEAAKRPVAPAPTPTPTPNPTPSTPSVPETPEEPTTEETPEVAPEEEVEDEEDVEAGEDILIMPPVDTEDEDTTQAPEEETETETDKPAATDIPKEEKPVEEVVADSEEAWTEIINKVVENEGKANITVQVTENTQVPASFIQAIAGQNIDVVIVMPNGIVWTISSDTVNGKAVDVNFHVDVDSHNIPTDVVNELAEDKTVIQISLAHSGEFGCHPVLTVPVGAENAGKYANLFYFNEETGVMEFMTYGLIGEDGKVDLQFVHASEYAIVIDTQFMGTVIDSVDTPLADIDAGPSPLIFILLIVCVAVGAVAVCYGLRKKEDRA